MHWATIYQDIKTPAGLVIAYVAGQLSPWFVENRQHKRARQDATEDRARQRAERRDAFELEHLLAAQADLLALMYTATEYLYICLLQDSQVNPDFLQAERRLADATSKLRAAHGLVLDEATRNAIRDAAKALGTYTDNMPDEAMHQRVSEVANRAVDAITDRIRYLYGDEGTGVRVLLHR